VSFIFRRGATYWYYWSLEGKKYGKSLKTADKEEAEVLKGEEDKRRLFNGTGMPSPTSRWDEFLGEYLKYSVNKKEPTTQEREARVLKDFKAAVRPTLFKDLSQRVIDSYLARIAADTSPANANVHYRHLKAIINKAVEWAYLPQSPFVGIDPYKIPKKAPRFLSKPEIDGVMSKAKKDPNGASLGLFMAFLWTGMRLSEVLGLKWGDVNFETRKIRVFGKGRKERHVPLHAKLRAFLEPLRESEGYVFGGASSMNLNTVQHIFRDRLLPPGTSVHTIRHTFASHALMSGMDLKTLQEILGHASITTTMIYAHLAPSHIEKGMEKVTFR
jgi:site-specific recombinase XerD